VYSNCPAWPTYNPTSVVYEATYENDGYTAERITFNSHTGTHMDAPFHFQPNGTTIDNIPVERFQGNAVLVDLRKVINAKEGINNSHLERYEERIQAGDIILLNTGWGKKRGFGEDYIRDWPYLAKEGARWLREKNIKGVGIDCVSLGGWYEGTGRPCHEELLNAEIWILEELNIPEELMNYEYCYLMAFPIKLQGFSGAPARAVAAI